MNTIAAHLSVLTGRPYHGLQSAPFNRGSFWLIVLALFFVGTCYALIRMFLEEGKHKRNVLDAGDVRYPNSTPTPTSD